MTASKTASKPTTQRRAELRFKLKKQRGLPFSGKLVPAYRLDLYVAWSRELEQARIDCEWDLVEALAKKLDDLEEQIAGSLSPDEKRLWAKGLVAR